VYGPPDHSAREIELGRIHVGDTITIAHSRILSYLNGRRSIAYFNTGLAQHITIFVRYMSGDYKDSYDINYPLGNLPCHSSAYILNKMQEVHRKPNEVEIFYGEANVFLAVLCRIYGVQSRVVDSGGATGHTLSLLLGRSGLEMGTAAACLGDC